MRRGELGSFLDLRERPLAKLASRRSPTGDMMLGRLAKWLGTSAIVAFTTWLAWEQVGEAEIINLFNYGELIHFGKHSEDYEKMAEEPDMEAIQHNNFMIAMLGLGHSAMCEVYSPSRRSNAPRCSEPAGRASYLSRMRALYSAGLKRAEADSRSDHFRESEVQVHSVNRAQTPTPSTA